MLVFGPGRGSGPCYVFPNNPEGLFQALLWAKGTLKDYRENGPCPTELVTELLESALSKV